MSGPLSPLFFRRLRDLCKRLSVDPQHLLGVMFFESVGVNPEAVNPQSGATGLIQFMPSTLKALGWTAPTSEFAKVDAASQLYFVERYLAPYAASKLTSTARVYQAVFLPASLKYANAPQDIVCDSKTRYPQAWASNRAAFDLGNKGFITVKDFGEAVTRATNGNPFRWQTVLTGLADEAKDTALARHYAGCSDKEDVARYLEVICRPSDASRKSYYLNHPSTCALFALGLWRLAGLPHKLVSSPYVVGQAVSDVQTVAGSYRALERGTPDSLESGDVWCIDDGGGYNAHVGVCVSDGVTLPDGSIVVDTVEGGQAPDSSGIQGFTRRFVPSKDGKLLMLGNRHIIFVCRHAKMPFPLSAPPPPPASEAITIPVEAYDLPSKEVLFTKVKDDAPKVGNASTPSWHSLAIGVAGIVGWLLLAWESCRR